MRGICNDLCKRMVLRIVRMLAGWAGAALVPDGCRVIPAGHFNFDPQMVEFFSIDKAKDAVNKAIIYQKFAGWIEHNLEAGRNIRDGQAWSYNTYDEWAEEIPFFHPKTIARHVRDFEALGLLKSEQPKKEHWNRVKHYTSPLRLDDVLEQTLLWPEHEVPTKGIKDSVLSSMNNGAMNNSTKTKANTTPTPARAGAYEALATGGVAQFPIPTGELPEKVKAAERQEPQDEHERHAIQAAGAARAGKTYPPVPPRPLSAEPETEEETESVDRTPAVDVPKWLGIFTDPEHPEIQRWYRGDADRLKAWSLFAPDRGLGGGYVRERMREPGCWPPIRLAMTEGVDAQTYVGGTYDVFIER